jgi:tellurite resistance protein TehA-like permease
VFGFAIALTMWGFAVIWFVIAALMILQARRSPFNMGWWGFIFPIGQPTYLYNGPYHTAKSG